MYMDMDNLEDRHVYKIIARNARYGIWLPETESFLISRFKFDNNYLFEEYHWDTGPPFGTAKPLEHIGPLPDHLKDVLEGDFFQEDRPNENRLAVLEYLNTLEEVTNEEG
jgi:hypothetical protein